MQMTTPAALPETLPLSSMARAMGSFLLNLIAHIELELLGGEFGSATCHDVLTHKQVMALGEAIAAGAAVASACSLRNPGIADIPDLLKKQAQRVRTASTMSRAARTAVALALDDAAGECCRRWPRSDNPDRRDDEDLTHRQTALDALGALADQYFRHFGALVQVRSQQRRGMNRQDVVDCYAWTDTGMGIVTALREHYVERATTWGEFLTELRDQVGRSTWEQASHCAEEHFVSMVAALLLEIAPQAR